MSNGYLQNQYSEYAPLPNTFAQSIASPSFSAGRRMGHVGEGANIAGLFGIQDPATSLVVNQLLQPILTGFIGGNYIPAQFSAGGNLYSQMKMGDTLRASSSAMAMAAQLDQRGIYDTIRGSAKLMGQPFGAREQAAASELAGTIGAYVPMMAQYNPEMVDKLYGARGSATVMAQNMFRGGRYAIDPTTGRRGYSADTAAEITKNVYERLYGDNADISQMSGLTAGKAGQMFDEMQRRGMMPNTGGRTEGIKQIADQLGTTIADVSSMPDLDRKLRELDANKISDRLKGMSRAVSAMQEIFGEMGQPDAPMSQLVGAIETLTQANMQNMDPVNLERMVRTTSATAKAAGIEMPEMFRAMGATAAYADRAGVNRALVPDLNARAVIENQAMKNIYGGVRGFGIPSADNMNDITRQLVIQAARDQRTYDAANIVRAVEQYGVAPQKGSELEAVYKAITNPESMGNYEVVENGRKVRKNIVDLMKAPGGVNQFMLKQGINEGIITNMLANRAGTEMFIDKYKVAEGIGRATQTDFAITGTAYEGKRVVDTFLAENAKGDVADSLRQQGLSEIISKDVAESLYNAAPEDIGDAIKTSNFVASRIRNVIKSRTGKDISQDDPSLKMLAGQMAGAADQFSMIRMNVPLAGAQMTLSKRVLEQAAVDKASIDMDVMLESSVRDLGKTDIFQRMSDFIRTADQGATAETFLASVFNSQKLSTVQERFGKDFKDVYDAVKGFSGYKAEDAKMAYIKDAITVNQAAMAGAKTQEERIRLEEEAGKLKADIASISKITPERAEVEFNAYLDQAKTSAGGDLGKAAKAAQQNLDTFEQRYGVTAEQAKTMNLNEIKLSGKKALLDKIDKDAKLMGIRLNAAGLVTNVSANRDVNQAVEALTSVDPSTAGTGMSLARNFISGYSLSPDLLTKGGTEGLDLKNKAQEIMLTMDRAAKSLGISQEDLLSGKLPADIKSIDLGTLKGDVAAEVNALKDLSDVRNNDVAFAERVNVYKRNMTDLENKTNRTSEEDRNLRTYKKILGIDRSKVLAEFEDAKARQSDLNSQTQASLNASISQYSKTMSDSKINQTQIDQFIKEYNDKNQDKKIDINQLVRGIEPAESDLKKVQSLREEKYEKRNSRTEVTRIDREIQDIIEKSGLDASSFNVLKEQDRSSLEKQLYMSKKLTPQEYDELKRMKDTVGKKIDSADKAFNAEGRQRLDSLEYRDIDNKEVIRLKTKNKDKDAEQNLESLLNKYKTSEDAIRDSKDKIIDLAKIDPLTEFQKKFTPKKQEEEIKDLFERAKAKQAGIKYGEAFVIKDGKAVPATDADIEAGRFTYINKRIKDGNIYEETRRYNKPPSQPGEYDRFKKLGDSEKEQLKSLREDRDKSAALLQGVDDAQANRYRELLIRESSPLSLDPKEMEKFRIKGGFESNDQLYAYESIVKDREKALEGMSPQDRKRITKLLENKQTLQAAKELASINLSKFDSRVLAGAMGKDAFKSLTDESKRQLIDNLSKLGQTITTGGSELSEARKTAIKDASTIISGDANSIVDLFQNKFKVANLNKDVLIKDVTDINTAAGHRKAASMLRMGMAEAGALSASGKWNKNTPEGQSAALYELLSSDDSKLSAEQRSLKSSLQTSGITKDLFASGGSKLDATKLKSLGDDFAREMNQKKAFAREDSKGGLTEVALKSGTELKMTGVVNVTGGDSALVGIVSNIANMFNKGK